MQEVVNESYRQTSDVSVLCTSVVVLLLCSDPFHLPWQTTSVPVLSKEDAN